MKRVATLTTTLLAGLGLSAQTARVQVIHNCADLAAAAVDVYLDETLLIDDFAFRTASPFIDAPAGVPFTVAIALPNSTSASEAIYTEEFTLTDGETYVIVASGTVSPTGYSPATPFSLAVYPMGRETSAGGAMMTDVLVYHGSTDAPVVDVYESAVVNTTVVDDIAYGSFDGYLELPTLDFTLQVRTADNSTVVAAYAAPLETLGLGGSALVAVASGFLDPSMNSNGPAFGIWVALPSGGDLVELPAVATGTARVQVIHNCADLAAASVDVYLDEALLIDDFAFRTASPFIDAPAGVPFTVGIALPNSTSASEAIYTEEFTLMNGGSYVIVASGTVSPTGYSPATPFSLAVFPMGREAAEGGAMMTDVLVYHGSTDAPVVDVYESAVVNTTVVDDIAYGSFDGYLELPTLDFTLQVRDANNSTIVAAYAAPLETLGLGGSALVAVASGFLDPTMNSNGPAFGIWVALPSGGDLVELPAVAIPTARVQVIHNSADLAAAEVDVWLNNTLLLDDFAFRTASPFVDAQAGVPFDVSIALPTSTDTTGALARFTYELEEGGTYILVANGIVSGSGYSPVQPFDIYVQADAREQSTDPGNVDVLVFHGSTDAPVVDVEETVVPAGTILDDIAYGEFAGYLELLESDYGLTITANGTPVAAYQAPLASLGLAGNAITVLASGFLDPSMNSNGAAFGLYVALPSGGDLVPLPITTGVSENGSIRVSSIFPNPTLDAVQLQLDVLEAGRTAITVVDAQGREVRSLEPGILGVGSNRYVIDLQDLDAGTYWLRVLRDDANLALPIVKQ